MHHSDDGTLIHHNPRQLHSPNRREFLHLKRATRFFAQDDLDVFEYLFKQESFGVRLSFPDFLCRLS